MPDVLPSSYLDVFLDCLSLGSFSQYLVADLIWSERSQYPSQASVLECLALLDVFHCHLTALGSIHQY